MTPILWLLIYLALAGLVVYLAIKLSNYVDLLDKKTKLSGALLGGILLAAVTSLPELFTSLTSTIGLGNNQFVLGNIVGSNFFDVVIFGFVYLFFFKKLTEGKLGKQHYFTIFVSLILTGCIALAGFIFDKCGWLFGWFNPMSIVILLIYIISIWKTPKTEEKEEEEKVDESSLTVKQIWTYFIICSVLLIGASIAVTFTTDQVVSGFNMGQTFGGSLFLGVATSLPEVTATIALVKKKNLNAAFGDIFGSVIFNCAILFIADALSFRATSTLYRIDNSSFMLIVGCVFALILSLISIIFMRSKKFQNNLSSRIIIYSIGSLLIISYIAYLILSNLNLSIF